MCQDRAPLEVDKPQLRPDIEKAADETMQAMTTHETSKDAYTAQLEKSKAAKVLSAEKLLDKAKADPKVQKNLKKKSKGRGRGRGKASDQPVEESAGGDGDANNHQEGEAGEEGADSVDPPKKGKPRVSNADNTALAEQWAKKETCLGRVQLHKHYLDWVPIESMFSKKEKNMLSYNMA